jgi:hypothetical protein
LWSRRGKCHQRRIDRGGPRGDLVRMSSCTARVQGWWRMRCRSSVARVRLTNMLGIMLNRNVSPRQSMIDQMYIPIALVRLLCLASQTLKSQTAAHPALKSPQRSMSRDCCTLGWRIRCSLRGMESRRSRRSGRRRVLPQTKRGLLNLGFRRKLLSRKGTIGGMWRLTVPSVIRRSHVAFRYV